MKSNIFKCVLHNKKIDSGASSKDFTKQDSLDYAYLLKDNSLMIIKDKCFEKNAKDILNDIGNDVDVNEMKKINVWMKEEVFFV